MKLFFEYGDVTKKYPEYVQAQCISEDCVMGSGVVIAYRKLFPGLKEMCKAYVSGVQKAMAAHAGSQEERLRYQTRNGSLRPYRVVHNGKVIYNMFTKKMVWMHAGRGITTQRYLENMQQSLEVVCQEMMKHGEQKLAISKIGCGRDRCEWEDVELILKKVFGETDIEICVCEYDEIKEQNHA